jgi:hypothetical protein
MSRARSKFPRDFFPTHGTTGIWGLGPGGKTEGAAGSDSVFGASGSGWITERSGGQPAAMARLEPTLRYGGAGAPSRVIPPPAPWSFRSPCRPDAAIGASRLTRPESPSFQGVYRTSKPSRHGTSGNRESWPAGEQHVDFAQAASDPDSLGTKDGRRPSDPGQSVSWSRATFVTQEAQAPGSRGIMANRPCWQLALIGMLTPEPAAMPWEAGNSAP